MRALGIDPGTVRMGVAISDSAGLVATPRERINADGDPGARIAAIADEEQCDTVVVGLPRALSGRDTASTAAARRFAEALREKGLTVQLWDERLSSAEADRALRTVGRRGEQRRTERDAVAAAVILQGWLDANRTTGELSGGGG
jgi:putative Holliday junction resolvase